ncbi:MULTISPECIES: YesK family protein [Pontibacillus]|uniref:YesK family protein n=1 Tax=Pontibacillus chungwhensis TaxID=265426 RepID=A0ABY8V0N3_9BACI|nr:MULTISPECIES: YesK family protein [Pontibacillus]MCD5322203.1 hypothetical protein [Pontibacillus sp. HN14]WIF99497.1 YesK family protein [Pontibacillus chungwhensis]
MSYLFMKAIITVSLISISLIFQKNDSKLHYIISPLFIVLSIVLLLISFFVGGWEGIGLGAISFSIMIASVISSIVMGTSALLKGCVKF